MKNITSIGVVPCRRIHLTVQHFNVFYVTTWWRIFLFRICSSSVSTQTFPRMEETLPAVTFPVHAGVAVYFPNQKTHNNIGRNESVCFLPLSVLFHVGPVPTRTFSDAGSEWCWIRLRWASYAQQNCRHFCKFLCTWLQIISVEMCSVHVGWVMCAIYPPTSITCLTWWFRWVYTNVCIEGKIFAHVLWRPKCTLRWLDRSNSVPVVVSEIGMCKYWQKMYMRGSLVVKLARIIEWFSHSATLFCDV